MSLCRQWTLVKNSHPHRLAKPLKCRSWGCELCAPGRKAQLMAKAAAGQPERFITLTVNPDTGLHAEDRLVTLTNAWRLIVKRLRRLHPGKPIEFLAVVERTKAGEPHLHILFRGPFIPQQWLSAAMQELAAAPIVDIRKVKSVREVIRYVAKYVSKEPAKFGSRKRYWSSANWEPPYSPTTPDGSPDELRWELVKEPLQNILYRWIHEGYAPRRDKGETIIGIFLDQIPHHEGGP